MKINYQEIKKAGKTNSEIFFLKNKNLCVFFSTKIKSRYFGSFLFLENKGLRFLDEINFSEEIKEVSLLSPQEVIFYFSQNQAYLNLKEDSLEITFSSWQRVNLTFDIKDIFQNEPEKRKILIKKIYSSCVMIEEFLADNGLVKILIEADSPLEIKENWKEVEMDFDKKRNSPPYKWWVYDGLEGKVRELKIKILSPQIKSDQGFFLRETEKQNSLRDFLLRRIEAMILNNYLAAGFMWFYENWLRDELLSLYLLKDFLDKNFLEQRLKFYLNNLELIFDKNKPQATLPGADTFPLLILNLDEHQFLTNFSLLEKYLAFWEVKFTKNNELFLPSFATWMDTQERKKSLEIISFYLKALRRFAKNNNFYIEKANYLKNSLKEEIKKSKGDVNIIFSFLVLEDLWGKSEWEKIFDELIKENYLDWGGLATLSKFSPNFHQKDDGELAKAYHQGDSWYFLNNLFAFCLEKINPKKYEKIIKKIYQASLEDLFFDGALGWSSEISSAQERKSEGSLVQLWSMSSLIFAFLKSQYLSQIFEQLT